MFDYVAHKVSDYETIDRSLLQAEAINHWRAKSGVHEQSREPASSTAIHALGVGLGLLNLGVACKYAGTRVVWPMACIGLFSEAVSLPAFLKDSKRIGRDFNNCKSRNF